MLQKKAKEKNLERKLRTTVSRLGGMCLKFVSPGFTGVPDRIVLMPGGLIYFVELKSEGRRLSARQRTVFAKMANNTCPVWVIDSEKTYDNFKNCIEFQQGEKRVK